MRWAPAVSAAAAALLLLTGCGTEQEPATTPSAAQATSAQDGSAAAQATPTPDPTPTETGAQETVGAEQSSPAVSQPPDDPVVEDALGAPGIPACDLLDLPATTLPVIEDIRAGGPYDYPRNDGYTFGNREGILPPEDPDYYREFTVETPGLEHRGARRIVTGGVEETDPEHWYFTSDHYESFCEFDPHR